MPVKTPPASQTIHSLLRPTILGAVGDEALDRVCKFARFERFKTPTLLCASGEKPRYLRLVVNGHIEIVSRNVSGGEIVFGYISPGSWATWLSCFMEIPPSHAFYSSPSACFVALPVEEVRAHFEFYPQLYPLVINAIGRRMRLLSEWTSHSVLVGQAQRLAMLLHILAREQGSDVSVATVHITQARLANQARCSRQTANQLLALLQDQGLVIAAYGKYAIPNMSALATFAGVNPI